MTPALPTGKSRSHLGGPITNINIEGEEANQNETEEFSSHSVSSCDRKESAPAKSLAN